jgi:hypothetical protein
VNDYWRYIAALAVGFAGMAAGSLAVASVVDTDSDDTFFSAFVAAIGVCLILFGVGTAIVSIGAYLTRRR